MTKTDATPGTITAGELRKGLDNILMVFGRRGRKIHRGYSNFGFLSSSCRDIPPPFVTKILCPSHCEIEYARLCRHCFHELLADTRP